MRMPVCNSSISKDVFEKSERGLLRHGHGLKHQQHSADTQKYGHVGTLEGGRASMDDGLKVKESPKILPYREIFQKLGIINVSNTCSLLRRYSRAFPRVRGRLP